MVLDSSFPLQPSCSEVFEVQTNFVFYFLRPALAVQNWVVTWKEVWSHKKWTRKIFFSADDTSDYRKWNKLAFFTVFWRFNGWLKNMYVYVCTKKNIKEGILCLSLQNEACYFNFNQISHNIIRTVTAWRDNQPILAVHVYCPSNNF